MPCKVWRKKHAEEARRFDEAYALLERHPELGLQEAFGLAQAGIPLEEWKARREKASRKQAVKSARAQVANDAVAAWFADAIRSAMPLTVVDAEGARPDTLVAEATVELTFANARKVEKLRVVLLGASAAWEQLAPALERDPGLAARPAPLHRQPDKRPISDARPFLAHVGRPVQVLLRNGLRLAFPLAAVGPFDLLLQAGEHRLLVPLHALVAWAPAESPLPASPFR
jgi:sRNA-binding regulator protein Hfq